MDSLMQSLSTWFSERPQWFQIAATQLFEQSSLSTNDISGIAIICQQEAEGILQKAIYPFPPVYSNEASGTLRICSIGNIEGINALAPKQPLDFGKSNISIIYGMNGSGKSGYVRLLKHVCGSRDPGTLHPNVYETTNVMPKACITFERNDMPQKYTWTGQGKCDDLGGVDIFDSSFGKFFVSDESEVSYEPPLLSFLSLLIELCEKVAVNLDAEASRYQSAKINMPPEIRATEGGKWYDSVCATTDYHAVDEYCAFNASHEATLQDLQQRLLEQDPADKAKQLKKQKQYTDLFIIDTLRYSKMLSDENCQRIIEIKKNWDVKKQVADIAADKVFKGCQLEGIGSEVWMELWMVARRYSTSLAYKEFEYPNISDDARCVLCHQILSQEAKERLSSFDDFVKGEVQKAALDACNVYENTVKEIAEFPDSESLKVKLDAMGIQDEGIVCSALDFFSLLDARRKLLLAHDESESFPKFSLPMGWLDELQKYSAYLDNMAEKYSDDAKIDKREQLKNSVNELLARKWLSDNQIAINDCIEQMKALSKLKEAKKLTNTKAISLKKGELSEVLITEAFVQRFANELKRFGASHIKVELVKSRVAKGRVLHKLQLKGSTFGTIGDVLSEGEARIISIAAFLADVAGKDNGFPFVFDDPISSLDQNYEEAVVQRLLEFSCDRQVIVFTHRLSLLGMITHYATKHSLKPDIMSIRSTGWGTGEPTSIPLSHSDIKTSLNILMEERIREAKRAGETGRFEYSEMLLKSICSDFRVIIERSIEFDLLWGIVERFQRPISSLKLKYLSCLKDDDWRVLDLLMTKYSIYEHSQPTESPIVLPAPDDIYNDMAKLKKWRDEYRKRVPA